MKQYNNNLKRSLTLFDLIIYGLIYINPISIYSIYGIIYNDSHGMVPLAYMLCGICISITALSYKKMLLAFPKGGSVYTYAINSFNKKIGFLTGWSLLLDYILTPVFLYIGASAALHALVPEIPQLYFSLFFIAINTIINLNGLKLNFIFNKIFLSIELLTMLIFIAIAFIGIKEHLYGAHWTLQPIFNSSKFNISIIFTSLSIASLSFLGFDGISTLSEDSKEKYGKNTGKAIVITIFLCTIFFIIQTYLASLFILNKQHINNQDNMNVLFYHVVHSIGGIHLKGFFIIIAAVGAGLASSMSSQIAGSRMLYVMARNNDIYKNFSYLSKKRNVPIYSIILISATSTILSILLNGNLKLISSIVSIGALTGFFILNLSVIKYYYLNNNEIQKNNINNIRKYLISPLIGALIITYIIYNAHYEAKLIFVYWILLGILYIYLKKYPLIK